MEGESSIFDLDLPAYAEGFGFGMALAAVLARFAPRTDAALSVLALIGLSAIVASYLLDQYRRGEPTA